jgi:hypothetical protein
MAKRKSTNGEHAIEGFAADLGNLLGSARSKAEDWLGQRKAIAAHLEEIRDTAAGLLEQLGHSAAGVVRSGRRVGRPAGRKNEEDKAIIIVSGKKKRKMSKAARARISAAQKKRWAKQKATAAK